MNALLQFYPGDAVAVLVANIAVQITVVALLAVLAARHFAKGNPAARHALLFGALVCVLLSPALSYLAYRADLAVFRIPASRRQPFDLPSDSVRQPADARRVSSAPAESEIPFRATPEPAGISNGGAREPAIEPYAVSGGQAAWSFADRLRAGGGALVVVWLVGVFWLGARLVHGCWFLSHLRRDLRFVGPSEIERLLGSERRHVGVLRLPRIGIADRVGSPITVGVLRPTIILPEQMLEKLGPEQLRDVLSHECAHVARRDHLVSLLQRFAEMVFWPHPLVHWLDRELARAREEVCDNYVLNGGDGVRYARTLLEVGKSLPSSGAVPGVVGLLPPRWKLENRIAGFLDANRKLVTHLSLWKATAMAAALLLLAVAVAGTVQAAPEDAAEPNADRMRPSSETSAPAPPAAPETVHARGRVVDPDGKPVQGAKVYVVYAGEYPWSPETAPQAVSGAEGDFQLGLSRAELAKVLQDRRVRRIRLLATSRGHGFSVEDLDARDPTRPLTLRLVNDLPIRGRLLNPEGKPVAGATIRIGDVFSPIAGKLDQYIEAVPDNRQWEFLARDSGWGGPLPGMPDPIVADTDGRFEITGIGAERVCRVYVAGPGIDEARLTVMTRETEPIKPFVQDRFHGETIVRPPVYPYYGATFEHVGSPARTIRVLVRDGETGRPLPGVRIQGLTLSGQLIPETDEQGRLEFPGRARLPRYEIEVVPHRQPYFADRVRIEDTPGLGPIDVTVDLAQGQLVTGRVTDRQTGEPVEGTLEYHSVFPDEHEERLGRSFDHPCSTAEVGADGSYAIAVLPGAGVLAFQASYKLEERQYMSALVDPADVQKLVEVEGVEVRGDDDFLETGTSRRTRILLGQRRYQSLELIKPAPGAELTVDLTCRRGRSLTGSVVGPDGEPVRDARVTGLYAESVHRETVLEGSTFIVRALNPRRTRPLLFYHAEKQLGAVLTLAGDRQEPLVVRLEPCGAVVGRVLDRQGQPVAGAAVLVNPKRLVSPDPPWTGKTDGEGRFRVDGIVPGQNYHARLPDQTYLFAFQLEPGQTKDLGTTQLR